MDTSSTSATLDDLAALTPQNYHRPIVSRPRRAGKTQLQRRYTPGRQVLSPTTRKTARPNTRLKAARHPWADRLHAARNGGLVIEQLGDTVLYRCHGCGESGGLAGLGSGSDEDFETQQRFGEDLRRHETGACVTGVSL